MLLTLLNLNLTKLDLRNKVETNKVKLFDTFFDINKIIIIKRTLLNKSRHK